MAVVGLAGLCSACAMSVPIGRPFVQLPGTEWRVLAVNGRATPTTGDYMMRFEYNRRLGARFGCNHMGGNYRSIGGTVTVSDLSQTLMGCPEPAATFESQASAILGARMRVDHAEQGRVTLSNAAGTILLGRTR